MWLVQCHVKMFCARAKYLVLYCTLTSLLLCGLLFVFLVHSSHKRRSGFDICGRTAKLGLVLQSKARFQLCGKRDLSCEKKF